MSQLKERYKLLDIKTLLFLILVFASLYCKSQTYSLQLQYKDSLEAKNINGIISIKRQFYKDSAIIIKINNGYAFVNQLIKSNYQIDITTELYKDSSFTLEISSDTLIYFQLIKNITTFSNARISANKNPYSINNGNIKLNLDNTVISNLPDAIEVLSKIPTVQVSGDRESISVLGRGNPLIYLGNQRITLNELNAIPVSDIKSVEVIKNPSSKYESDGMAVILITRKYYASNVSKIDLSENAAMKRLFENRLSINSNFKKDNNEWRSSIQYNHINRWEGLDGKINSQSRLYNSGFNGTSIGLRRQLIGALGFYRQIQEKTYFSLNLSGRLQDEIPIIKTNSFETISSSNTSFQTHANNFHERPFLNGTINYEKAFKNNKIFIGSQGAFYSRKFTNEIFNNIQNTQFNLTENRFQDFNINVFSTRLDYEKSLKKSLKLEAGVIANYANSYTFFRIDSSNQLVKLNEKYHYTELNEGLYAQISGRLKKIQWMIGFRVENTDLKGTETYTNRTLLNRQFNNILPKLQLHIPIDSLKSFTFNYSNYLTRPDYSNLNQTTNYITPFLERANNLFINPSKIQDFSAVYQYKKVSVSSNFRYTKNPVYYITDTFQSNGSVRIINKNLKEEISYNIGLNIPIEYKKYHSTTTINTFYNQIADYENSSLVTKPFIEVSSNHQFKFKRQYSLGIIAWYSSKKYVGLFTRNAQYALDFICTKKIKNKLTIALNALDIFRSLNYRESFNINGIYSDITYFENLREFSILIKYTIGRLNQQKFKSKDINEGRIN